MVARVVRCERETTLMGASGFDNGVTGMYFLRREMVLEAVARKSESTHLDVHLDAQFTVRSICLSFIIPL
jgi:hypothetical protein